MNVELARDSSIFAKSLERTDHDELNVKAADDRHFVIRGREVARVTWLSTPLEPATPIGWDSIPFEIHPPCTDCYCSEFLTSPSFFESHVGVEFRGPLAYTRQTAAGTQIVNAQGFGSMSEDGTTGAYKFDVAFGFRWVKWRLGIMSGVLPSDGSVFVPVALHGAYDLGSPIIGLCPNLFANVGLPFDFRTHAPIFYSSFRRQRKFASGGFGLERPLNANAKLSFNIGLQYVTLPLSEVFCCPTLPHEDHFPSRSILSSFITVGLSF